MSEPAPPEDNAGPTRQIALGFMFSHSIEGEISRRLLDAAAGQTALLELLQEQGVIDPATFAERRQAAHEQLALEMAEQGLGLYLNDQHEDKYTLTDLPEIDCAARVHLCHAACCSLRFPLSRQDVEEGVVRWDYGRPYWNLRVASGYCAHWQGDSHACAIYSQRPGPCRTYDCRQDERIWVDFETMQINPALTTLDKTKN